VDLDIVLRLEKKIDQLLDHNRALMAECNKLSSERDLLLGERSRLGAELDRILAKLDRLDRETA